MLVITRYILKQLILGTAVVSLALSCLLWLTQSLRFVELIIYKGLSIGAFVYLTMLLLPNFLTILTPIALFAVLLFTYNRLDADREMVVMRASGMSQVSLAMPGALSGALFTLLALFLNIFVIPASVLEFREMQWAVKNDISRVLLQEGTFNQVSNGVTVYVRARSSEGELLDVLVHDTRKREKEVTMMAERGALVKSDGRPRILLINGNRQEMTPDSGKLSLLYFDSYTVEMASAAETHDRFRDARERSLKELFSLTQKEVGAVDFARFRVEAHQRISAPLYHLTFAAIGLACLLTGTFSRHGQTKKVITAIAFMVLIEALQLGVTSVAVKNLALVPFIYLTPVLPMIAGLYFLVKTPSRRRRPAANLQARPA